MAGRAGAHPDDVFTDRAVAELGIKGRNTRYRGWRYFGDFTNPPESALRKIVVFLLNGMQDRDNIAGFFADIIDNLVDKKKDSVRLLFHDFLIPYAE